MKRHQRAELLQRIVRPHWGETEAGQALSLMRSAASDLSLRPATPEIALRVLREHAGRLGLREVYEGLAGVQPGRPRDAAAAAAAAEAAAAAGLDGDGTASGA